MAKFKRKGHFTISRCSLRAALGMPDDADVVAVGMERDNVIIYVEHPDIPETTAWHTSHELRPFTDQDEDGTAVWEWGVVVEA